MAMMRAVEIGEPGGPRALRVTERPKPEPGEGEVLVATGGGAIGRGEGCQGLAQPDTVDHGAGGSGDGDRGDRADQRLQARDEIGLQPPEIDAQQARRFRGA